MDHTLATLSGWGRVARSSSVVLTPTAGTDLGAALTDPRPRAHGLIARGAGRSYGDAALNAEGHALLTSRLDRILDFDEASGMVQAEPGVTFAQLLATFLPQGFLVPVAPGTGFATLGGAVAHDVHGKNHEVAGSFGQHVAALDLLCPDGRTLTIGPDRYPALFRATVGGLGLTGVITRVAFRMKRAEGPGVRLVEQRVADLDAFLDALDAARGATYVVGWIDGTAQGAALGRGILQTAEIVPDALPRRQAGRGRTVRVPLDLPEFVLSPLSIRVFNAAYWRRVPREGRTRLVGLDRFLAPLDALHDWNRIYGRRGFHQFQCVVPFEVGRRALRDLLDVVVLSRRASFLAVLKRLGPGLVPAAQAGMLSFPQAGYTLALDFPAGPGIGELYARLAAIALRHGGRVYLAKDALLSPTAFRHMYPQWREFRAMLEQVDPGQRLQSDMSRRLGIRDA